MYASGMRKIDAIITANSVMADIAVKRRICRCIGAGVLSARPAALIATRPRTPSFPRSGRGWPSG
jgi:hypothetical protein